MARTMSATWRRPLRLLCHGGGESPRPDRPGRPRVPPDPRRPGLGRQADVPARRGLARPGDGPSVGLHQPQQVREGPFQESGVVAHVLDGGVDLVAMPAARRPMDCILVSWVAMASRTLIWVRSRPR
jgi:hypothetical protein